MFRRVAACSDEPATSLFAPPGDPALVDDFYALPFPNDVHRAGGRLDLTAFPANSLTVEAHRAAVQELDGFGTNQAIFARFDGPLVPDSLPDAAASVKPGAAVYSSTSTRARRTRASACPSPCGSAPTARRRSARTT